MTGVGTALRPRPDSALGLDLTVRRDGLHLAVRGTLDAAGNHRLVTALGTAATAAARELGLPTCTPLRLVDWQAP